MPVHEWLMRIYAHANGFMRIYAHANGFMRIYAHANCFMRIYAHANGFMRIYAHANGFLWSCICSINSRVFNVSLLYFFNANKLLLQQ